jgi:hypothetical protein
MVSSSQGVLTPGLVQVQTAVRAAVLEGRPFNADEVALLGKAQGYHLYRAFTAEDVNPHNILHHPVGGMVGHAKREKFLGRGPLRLLRAWNTKRATGRSRPAVGTLLHALRQSWQQLTRGLPEPLARRLRHVMQVQACPALITAEFPRLTALTFSVSHRTRDVGTAPVPLSAVVPSWLTFGMEQGKLTTTLHEGRLECDAQLEPRVVPEAHYDFAVAPTLGGQRPTLPVARAVSVDTALSLHEAVEQVVVTGTGLTAMPAAPRLYLAVEPTLNAQGQEQNPLSTFECDPWVNGGQVTPALRKSVMDKLRQWWTLHDTRAIRAQVPAAGRYADPGVWLDFIAYPEADPLPVPTESWDGVVAQLGEGLMPLLTAVWLSDLREHRGRILFPLDYFAPDSPQRAQLHGDLYAIFPPGMLGCDSYQDGVLQTLPLVCRPQVCEIAGG